jgi:hypothetical protein
MKRIRAGILKLNLFGALRVLGLLIVVQLVAGAVWLRSAHARASEALLSVGAELMKLEGADHDQPVRSIFLNGITMHLRTGSTDRELHTVLDRFHALCRTRTGVEAPQAVLDKLQNDSTKHSRSRVFDGVLRAESDSSGAIACIDTGVPLSVAELTSRLQEFARTGDLSAVGELRYVLARRLNGKTTVLSLWSEGSMPLLKMFPVAGDAPGQDLPELSRPPATRRLLSTWENGQPYSLTGYTADGGKVASLVAFYEADLRARGWALETTSAEKVDSKIAVIMAHRAERTLLLRIGSDRRGAATVSIAMLG